MMLTKTKAGKSTPDHKALRNFINKNSRGSG